MVRGTAARGMEQNDDSTGQRRPENERGHRPCVSLPGYGGPPAAGVLYGELGILGNRNVSIFGFVNGDHFIRKLDDGLINAVITAAVWSVGQRPGVWSKMMTALRENSKMTQERVAELVNITVVYLSKIENGKVLFHSGKRSQAISGDSTAVQHFRKLDRDTSIFPYLIAYQ